ncbi:MAG: sulfotransferase domain-containing protein [Pseudomonadota bacterium]
MGIGSPLVYVTTPKAGTHAFRPVFRNIISWFGYEEVALPSANSRRPFITAMEALGENIDLMRNAIDNATVAISPLLNSFECVEIHDYVSPEAIRKHNSIQCIYLIRDPRDLYVSMAHYEKKMSSGEAGFGSRPVEEILSDLLKGRIALTNMKDSILVLPAIRRLAENFCSAKCLTNVFAIKYEDIRLDARNTYIDLMKWLGFDALPQYGQFVENGPLESILEMYSFENQVKELGTLRVGNTTNTLRKGSPGDWKNYFTPELKEEVKELIGKELIELGYEKNYDW